jgi:outer membrane protein assembly factor BamB
MMPFRCKVFMLLVLMLAAGSARADLLVSGQNTNSIFRFDETTGEFLGKLLGPDAGLSSPVGMRIGPDGDLYIANQASGVINRYNFATSTLSVFASTGFAPTDIQFNGAGQLITSDFFGTGVYKFDLATGTNLGQFVTGGSLLQPTNMLISSDLLYVSSLGTGEVQRFDATTGAYVDTFISSGSAGLTFPAGLAINADDDLLVSSLLTHQILRFDGSTGAQLNPVPWLVTPTDSFPSDLLVDGNGDLLIATTGSFGVLKYDGTSLTTFASHPDLQIAGQLLIVPVPEASSIVLCAVASLLAIVGVRPKRPVEGSGRL